MRSRESTVLRFTSGHLYTTRNLCSPGSGIIFLNYMQKHQTPNCLSWATQTHLKRIIIALILCLIADKQMAAAASANTAPLPDAEPEIIANSWEDNNEHFANVTLNGKEVLRMKQSATETATVEDKVEDIAAKLDQLLKNKKFNAQKLYPVKTADGIIFKVEGTELFKLSAVDVADVVSMETHPVEPKSTEYGLKLANIIRETFGAKALPLSFLKLAELTARRSVDTMAAIAGASVTGRFSGTASWYGPHFHGRKCSDGTRFDQEGLTAAHRSLPFGTKLLVMNRKTGDSCIVKVNDRGPFVGNRVLDLSKGAARQINMLGSGVTMVDCIVLGKE